MGFLSTVFQIRKSKKVISKHIRLAIDEICLELELKSISKFKKEKLERALYDLYMQALDSNSRFEKKNRDKEVTKNTNVDAINRANYLASRIREDLSDHPALTKQDQGTLIVYTEQAIDSITKLVMLLSEKVR